MSIRRWDGDKPDKFWNAKSIEAMQKDAELVRSMPKLNGIVIDPRYAPVHQKAKYMTVWGKWLRSHPKSDWKPWMHDLVNFAKAARQTEKPVILKVIENRPVPNLVQLTD
jgi:hypothetical protein